MWARCRKNLKTAVRSKEQRRSNEEQRWKSLPGRIDRFPGFGPAPSSGDVLLGLIFLRASMPREAETAGTAGTAGTGPHLVQAIGDNGHQIEAQPG